MLSSSEFEESRQDDAQFHFLEILRHHFNLEFAVYGGNIETLFYIHKIVTNDYGEIALVENSGELVSYLEWSVVDPQQLRKRLSHEARFQSDSNKLVELRQQRSYRSSLQSESKEFSKMIMDLKTHQIRNKSLKIYRHISQFFVEGPSIEDGFIFEVGDFFEELLSFPLFYISNKQLFRILEVAMMQNETDIVEKIYSRFSSTDLDQSKFATPQRLDKFYTIRIRMIKENSLADIAGLSAWINKDRNELSHDELDRITELIVAFESSLISTSWNPFANRCRDRTDGEQKSESSALMESFETHDPEERLFCWALLFELWDLANLIWLRSKYGIGLAILGAAFLRGAAALKRRDISG